MDSSQIFYNDKHYRVLSVGGSNVHTTNARWQTAAILKKIEKATYLGLPNSSYHTEIPALVFNNAIHCFNSHCSGESGLAGLLPPLVLGQNLSRNVTQVSMGQTFVQ